MEPQKTLYSQSNLEKEQSKRYHAPWFQTILQSHSNQTVWYSQQNRHLDKWNGIKRPKINPGINGQLIYNIFFELWCWRRLLRVPWTVRRSNQSIQKEITPEYSLEGLMLKLKLQYFGHLMQRTVSFKKILMLGKIVGRRIRGRQRMRWVDCNTDSIDMSLSKLLELVMDRDMACCSPWDCKESDTTE